MNENAIFFFSGTGNSFDITKRIAEKLGNTDIFNIANIKVMPVLDNYKKIGLIFPVYGFTMPNIVARFISQLKINENVYNFSVVTMGAFALGAMYRTMEAYNKINIKLNYITNVYMPENYILFSNVPSDKLIKTHLDNSVKRVTEIVLDIQQCKEKPAKKSIFYNFVKKTSLEESGKWAFTAKSFVINNDCVKCKKCINICPVNNISYTNENIVFGEHCECCLACIHSCPKQAINYGDKTIGKKRYINQNIKIEEIKTY
ncbi:4Fe-4S ferredoxin [Spirochaetia bacterium]|nr:4Fe-4S ferredoxin [Spirochaetia bacterium]